jgi:hypothetical protein
MQASFPKIFQTIYENTNTSHEALDRCCPWIVVHHRLQTHSYHCRKKRASTCILFYQGNGGENATDSNLLTRLDYNQTFKIPSFLKEVSFISEMSATRFYI